MMTNLTVKTALFFIVGLLSTVVQAAGAGKEAGFRTPSNDVVTVYRSPSCGCCKAWLAHMKENGFEIVDVPTADMNAVKQRLAIPARLRSCHTAMVGGYVIEGHVPAVDVRRLLRERPEVSGVAVPGMPAGSPGMEVAGRQDRYQVFGFTGEGQAMVYQVHDPDSK